MCAAVYEELLFDAYTYCQIHEVGDIAASWATSVQ